MTPERGAACLRGVADGEQDTYEVGSGRAEPLDDDADLGVPDSAAGHEDAGGVASVSTVPGGCGGGGTSWVDDPGEGRGGVEWDDLPVVAVGP